MTPVARNRWILAGCSGVLFAVLAFLSSMALRAEEMEQQAQRERDYQEAIRQALWRMDSALTPILVQEASRPAEHYTAMYTDRRVANVTSKGSSFGLNLAGKDQRLVSPLLGFQSDWIRLHFYTDLRATLSPPAPDSFEVTACSPQVPAVGPLTQEEVQDTASAFPEEVESARKQLAALQALFQRPGVLEKLGFSLVESLAGKKQPQIAQQSLQQSFAYPNPSLAQDPEQKTEQDYQARQGSIAWAQNALSNAQRAPVTNLEPVWLLPPLSEEPELFLLRTSEGKTLLQGIWLDWSNLKKWLCQGTASLFPNAQLRPAGPNDEDARGRTLASIPVVLDPGPWKGAPSNPMTMLRWLIAGAWGVSIAAFTVLRLALSSATEFGERRGRFVSAVTHELRTPLTTFQLYSQMLADGMVPDEKSRKEYLETLKKESERLARIVENVLLYARVEGKRTVQRREAVATEALLERVRPALERRAQDCGMEIAIDLGAASSRALDTDPQIVEQILLNLVDNSCKYARGASDRRLHLIARAEGERLAIEYSDHGPGIAPQDQAKLFQPFQRGEAQVASNVSGIGLGLSLAKALACDLGGDLSFVKRADSGACFRLQIPFASR